MELGFEFTLLGLNYLCYISTCSGCLSRNGTSMATIRLSKGPSADPSTHLTKAFHALQHNSEKTLQQENNGFALTKADLQQPLQASHQDHKEIDAVFLSVQ